MKNKKILKKLENLNLHNRITFLISGKIEVIVRDNKVSHIALSNLLSQFKPKKYNLKLAIKNNELVLEITKIPSLECFSTDPALIPGYMPSSWRPGFPLGRF